MKLSAHYFEHETERSLNKKYSNYWLDVLLFLSRRTNAGQEYLFQAKDEVSSITGFLLHFEWTYNTLKFYSQVQKVTT